MLMFSGYSPSPRNAPVPPTSFSSARYSWYRATGKPPSGGTCGTGAFAVSTPQRATAMRCFSETSMSRKRSNAARCVWKLSITLLSLGGLDGRNKAVHANAAPIARKMNANRFTRTLPLSDMGSPICPTALSRLQRFVDRRRRRTGLTEPPHARALSPPPSPRRRPA